MSARKHIRIFVVYVLALVSWNLAWYFSVHGILSAKFKASALPVTDQETKSRYLFRARIAFDGAYTNTFMRLPNGKPTVTELPAVGYDPISVLGNAYHYFRSSDSDCDVEITVEVSNQTLSLDFKPHRTVLNSQGSVFESWLLSPHKKNTYRIGEDCIRCGDNTFAFRYVTTSGGYGLGQMTTEVISTISFETNCFHYDIKRSSYGLYMWVIPCIEKLDDTHLTMESIEKEF